MEGALLQSITRASKDGGEGVHFIVLILICMDGVLGQEQGYHSKISCCFLNLNLKHISCSQLMSSNRM